MGKIASRWVLLFQQCGQRSTSNRNPATLLRVLFGGLKISQVVMGTPVDGQLGGKWEEIVLNQRTVC